MAIERTSAGLANAMFDELDKLNTGESTPQEARAKASIANSIISICRLEIDYSKYLAGSQEDRQRLPSFAIGLPKSE